MKRSRHAFTTEIAGQLNRGLGKFGLKLVRAADGRVIGPGGAEIPDLVPLRVTRTDIEMGCRFAWQRFPDRSVVILVCPFVMRRLQADIAEIAANDADVILCEEGSDARAAVKEIDSSVFVYACDSDSAGLPFIRVITEAGGFYIPAPGFQPASYGHVNGLGRAVIEAEHKRQKAEGFDKFDLGPGDFLNIIQLIEVTRSRPGAYVEIGCFRGSSGTLAVRYMREAGVARDCHFLDIFSGFDYDAAKASADAMWEGTHATEGPEVVGERLQTFADPDRGLGVSVHRSNIITDELPHEIGPIALANIDVDIYEAVLAALLKVAPKIVPGGVMIAEDAGHTPACIGARLALDEFQASDAGAGFMPVYMESGQTLFIRGGADGP